MRIILESASLQMGQPAGIRVWRGGHQNPGGLSGHNHPIQECDRKNVEKTEENAENVHAVMSPSGKWKQSCNPILIAVDLLNRSSRFKSQQITQKAQGEVHRLCNKVHFRWCFILDEAGPSEEVRGRLSGSLLISFRILVMEGFIPTSSVRHPCSWWHSYSFRSILKHANSPLVFPVWSAHWNLLPYQAFAVMYSGFWSQPRLVYLS